MSIDTYRGVVLESCRIEDNEEWGCDDEHGAGYRAGYDDGYEAGYDGD
jgi:hypothetical protein